MPAITGDKATGIAGTVLGGVIVLTFIAATLPFGLTKTSEVAQEFDGFQEAVPLAMPDPVAWWKLDEPPGATSFADSSGNGNTGTCLGINCPTTGSTGRFGNAVFVNGNDQFVEVADSPSLSIVGDLTLSAWFYPTAYDNNFPRIVDKAGTGTTGGYRMNARNDPSFLMTEQFTIQNAGSSTLNTNAQHQFNAWNHLVGTYDGTTMALYLNGDLVGTLARTGPIADISASLFIGSNTPHDRDFTGYLDDVRIYDEALTPGQIQEIYDPGSGTTPAGSAHSSVAAFTIPVVLALLASLVFVGLSYFTRGK